MNDRQKVWRIGMLMRQENAYDLEEEALALAYSIQDRPAKERALKRIADRMCTK
jgi:hypothetical protein